MHIVQCRVYICSLHMIIGGREGVLGDAGVLVDGNITTTVIDMKILYINELCIILTLPNILRKIEEKLNILNNIIDYVKSAFSAILL